MPYSEPNGVGGMTSRIANGVNHVSGDCAPRACGLVCPDHFRDVPAYTPRRKLKVVTVGAGFSGLLFAHKLQHQYPEMQRMVEHKILESRPELGGTWLVNTYPGIQCDVPAHIYVRCSCATSHVIVTYRPTGIPLRPKPRMESFLCIRQRDS